MFDSEYRLHKYIYFGANLHIDVLDILVYLFSNSSATIGNLIPNNVLETLVPNDIIKEFRQIQYIYNTFTDNLKEIKVLSYYLQFGLL